MHSPGASLDLQEEPFVMTVEPTPEQQEQIKHAAFEAAYREMIPPDPASPHFARRVAEHEERLRQEQAIGQGTVPPSD